MKILKKLNVFILLICLFVPITLAGCENKNKSSLSTPQILEINGGTIVFNQVNNAEYYTISINNKEFNVDVAHNTKVEIIDNLIHYDASKIFIIGNSYSVKVRANNSKLVGDYSSTTSYMHAGSISTPSNLQINGTTLTWDAVENASYYIVKAVTPNDVLKDKNGNLLESDDSKSIEKADLTEHTTNINNFKFNPILSSAGVYKFYVKAVLSNYLTLMESDYTVGYEYAHNIQLETPTLGEIFKEADGSYHVSAIIDSNANTLEITLNDSNKTIEVSNSSIRKFSDYANLFDINLTELFNLSDDLTQATISITAKKLAIPSYFIDSTLSNESSHTETKKLNTPENLQVVQNGSDYFANWSNTISEADGYNLVIATETGITEYHLTTQTSSMQLPNDFQAVAIQAIGKGNFLSSNLTEFVSKSTTELSEDIQLSISSNTISWRNIHSAYYILELNNSYIKLTSSQYTIPDSVKDKIVSARLHVISNSNSFAPKASELTNLTQEIKLSTPTNLQFNSENIYELSFDPVDNAFGYCVYIKGKTASNFEKIDRIYTSNRINLINEICKEGEFSEYNVKVVAIADPYSKFTNSYDSSYVDVIHVKTLSTPKFVKLNGIDQPIVKETDASSTKYYLQFEYVQNAKEYEISINYNRKTVSQNPAYTNGSIYKIDITEYIKSASQYTIKIKAIADPSQKIKDSAPAKATYNLIKQLNMVDDIDIVENEELLTYELLFGSVPQAVKYQVRIVKENDPNYTIGNGNIIETIDNEVLVTDYVKAGGVYYFYVTAIAEEGSNYSNSQESTTYARLNKLTTLKTPSNITFSNNSATSFEVLWEGDEHADYYMLKITDPNNLTYEKSTNGNAESININDYITIQGEYKVSISSKVRANSENSKEYMSSNDGEESYNYQYILPQDFIRYSISMQGIEYNFNILDAKQLTNILWYNYLYDINPSLELRIMIQPNEKDNKRYDELNLEDHSKKENLLIKFAIERMAQEATGNSDWKIYDFEKDTTWQELLSGNTNNVDLLTYLCEKIVLAYPELHMLKAIDINNDGTADATFHVHQETGENFFRLNYHNAFNGEKTKITKNYGDQTTYSLTSNISLVEKMDFGNKFNYIPASSRRSKTAHTKIDDRKEEMTVTTTEQLLHAVQHNKKPRFVGDCSTAENVYKNAKLVLSAIITSNMTDLEKVTAIFDWLEYGFEITHYSISDNPALSGTVEAEKIDLYGKYEHYYLEGIFNNISLDENENIIIGNKFATSWSYSKAFALLCAIEGIDALVVYGNYEYGNNLIADHVWNKIYLDIDGTKQWYNVDLTFSDNKIDHLNLSNNCYGVSSHSYFLVSDSRLQFGNKVASDSPEIIASGQTYKNLTDKNNMFTNEKYSQVATSYDYYSNTMFGLNNEQVLDLSGGNLSPVGENIVNNSKKFPYMLYFPNTFGQEGAEQQYQKYDKTQNLGPLQDFIFNLFIYGKHIQIENGNGYCTIECEISNKLGGFPSDFATMNPINNALSTGNIGSFNVHSYATGNMVSMATYNQAKNSTIYVLCFKAN